MDYTSHQAYMSPVKRKVLGDLNNTGGSPISPNANLKLLTKVASQFRLIENLNNNTEINLANFYSIKVETKTPPKKEAEESFDVFGEQNLLNHTHKKGIRKFKSLGFLCDKAHFKSVPWQNEQSYPPEMNTAERPMSRRKRPGLAGHAPFTPRRVNRKRFLKLYPLNVGSNSYNRITLTDVANNLGVEKRRVYDIINVVESLQMATRVGKNTYVWTGHKKLVDILSQLKAYAEQIGLEHYVRSQQISRRLYLGQEIEETEQTESSAFVQNSNIASFFKNERRIGILCQKFVMLFLVSLKDGLINLDLAVNVLMSENCHQNKTRLRRLYDIANILVSLGIITKLDTVADWKKPVFKYIGPSLDSLTSLNVDGSFINKFAKTEYSDENSSDSLLSEDSREPWRSEHTNLGNQSLFSNQPTVHWDHSYSLAFDKSAEKKEQSGENAVKKRLFLAEKTPEVSKESSTREPVDEREPALESVEVKPSPTTFRVVDQGSLPQPITDGGVYKALRVGNNIQLIRIDA